MRTATIAAGLLLALGGAGQSAGAEADALFGLRFGMSAEEATEAADASVLHWSIHQSYGQSFELDRLPAPLGDEIHRILYFNDANQLLRVWVSFGEPGGEIWEKHYTLPEATAQYRALKTRYGLDRVGSCREPELEWIDTDAGRSLAPRFARDRPVWSCTSTRDGVELTLSLRRLGDPRGARFDVVIDAQDPPAVLAYRAKHPLRGRGHGALFPTEPDPEAESVEIDCDVASASDRSTMDTSPFALLYRRICDYESSDEEEEAMRRFDEVILLD